MMQACLDSLSDTLLVGKFEFRTNTRTAGACGEKVIGADLTNKGEIFFEI